MSNQTDNRKVSQLAKRMSKKSHPTDESENGDFVDQYRLIREDLMKLRGDLTRGYSMAKNAFEKKTIVSELMKLRGSF